MSQAQPSPILLPFSPHSSRTFSEAELTRPPEIRYATVDDDVIAIHRFLLVIAQPVLLGPVDPVKSLLEIIRITKEGVAIMALIDDYLVGTLGLMQMTWWYGPGTALVDRWNFCVPECRNGSIGQVLEMEAQSIAATAGLKFINQGKIRERKGRYLMMPRLTPPPES